MKKVIFCICLLCGFTTAVAQKNKHADLQEAINLYLQEYSTEYYKTNRPMRCEKVNVDTSERILHIYTNEPFYSQLFCPDVVKRVYEEMEEILPSAYKHYTLKIYGGKQRLIEELIPNYYRKDDKDKQRLWGKIEYCGNPWVSNVSIPYKADRGLSGHHLMIWASHGLLKKEGRWDWQRPYLFCTTEDLLSQSFVYPFLFPMLEKAGAIIYTPRERDYQVFEAVVDNDTPTSQGKYNEVSQAESPWYTSPDSAFSVPYRWLTDSIEPFKLGSARLANTTSRKAHLTTASWTPNIPQKGRYAVYVSYPSRPNSVSDAHYTVYHCGGKTNFRINQQMGGGTWVYLGTFEFDKGEHSYGRVVLSNQSDYRGVVGADAVRFGGGMGQNEREGIGTSGVPRFLEAARYYTQWSGLPDTLYNTEGGLNDYYDDLRCRSNMLNHLGGGSPYMPHLPGKKVPLELALAVHTDAGIRPDHSIYGSLSICTSTRTGDKRFYDSGISRMASYDLAAILLNNVTRDLSASLKKPWVHRELLDRNYSETRSPEVPSAILEMLSHQNYGDMKYAHDPIFKFYMSRAIYKSVLRYVSEQHDKPYVVQPLPVDNFSALLSKDGKTAKLQWSAREDSLEASARPTSYIVYTKMGEADFDNGQLIAGGHTSVTIPISEGIQYSFKVTAVNRGGESFPSEVLSVYKAPQEKARVLILNGFCRVSGSERFEHLDSIGFDLRKDIGVPYLYTTAFAGRQLNFNASTAGGEGPEAFGYCSNELVGKAIAGNTFDYPITHGNAIASSQRYSFSSCSKNAIINGNIDLGDYQAIDYIGGLEKNAPQNLRPFKVFPQALRDLLSKYLNKGGNLFASGAYLGTDLETAAERSFAAEYLKYQHAGVDTIPYSALGADSVSAGPIFDNKVQGLNLQIPISRTLSDAQYAVQSADALLPASDKAFSIFLYADGKSAGIAYPGNDYKVVVSGFPFESILSPRDRSRAMTAILDFLIE